MRLGLVDTHAHLDEVEDLEGVLQKAGEAGVSAIVAVGCDIASNRRVLEIALRYPGFVYPAIGYHPQMVRGPEIEENLDFIRNHLGEAVALGEVGLDYAKWVRANADNDVQKEVLRRLLGIAISCDRPVIIHSRYAWRDACDLVREAGIRKAVFHWFTGTSSVLRDIVAEGFYLSVTPAVTYHEEHRRVVKEVPLSRLLLETDTPVVYGRGTADEFRATPADVLRSLKGAAAVMGGDEAELAGITTQNAAGLFGLDPR
ncbi:MAG: TatD family hydrolase [Dehalococcoidales bacterium]|nr:TatD family hydrolase [Dehalococcoidales bacterium]